MIKKGIVVTIIFIISTFVQLVSQIVVTRIFGAKLDLDIFLAAVAVPTIFVTVIYGTLNDAFLPLLGKKTFETIEEKNSYFINHLLALSFISFIFSSALTLFSQPITQFLYASRGEEFIKNVSTQMSFMFFSIPLAVIATILGSYFYVQKKFIRFPVAQLIGSVTNLIMIILLSPFMGIWALVIAFVLNIAFQIILVIPRTIFTFEFKIPNLIPLLLAWIPLIIGSFALRSDTLLIRSFASSLPTGSIVYLNLITKIFSLSTSVLTVGIQIILLPHLVEFISQKQYEKAIKNVNTAKLLAIGISTVVSVMLALIAPYAINLLFVGGKFTKQDADATIQLIPLFILPAIGWGINSVFFQPLLALHKHLQLGILNVLALAAGWGSGLLAKNYINPLAGITTGLIVLLFFSIIGSEVLWQYHKRKLISSVS